jgi:uncharacterized repeat protein (TIGR01451 family)/CSLREA domain-containing protein
VIRFRPAVVLAALFVVFPAAAATFNVDITSDTVDANIGDGTCADAGGDCSLRAAIQEANFGGGPHTINVPAGTYTLSIAGAGEDLAASGDLDVREEMTIVGASAETTIIDANGIDRVFSVLLDQTVTIRDLAVTGGHPGVGNGGGIYNDAFLTLERIDVFGNRAGTDTGSAGGGLYNVESLTVIDSTIRNNFGARSGAGIGAFCLSDTVVTIRNSTISGNVGETQEGNAPLGGGIGIDCSSVQVFLSNVTITNNTAAAGGGIYNPGTGGGGALELRNSIIAGNTAAQSPDCGAEGTSFGYNLIGNSTDCGIAAATGDQFDVDAALEPLADNGGTTMTHEIPTSSPAFDGGDPDGCEDEDGNAILTDQRGVSRPQAARCDMGAFEQDVYPTADLMITKSGGATGVAGSTVTYTIQVENTGGDAATGVVVTDTADAGLTFVSGTGGCASGFPWNIGPLAVAGTASCTATFSIAAGTAAGAILDNTAAVTANEFDDDDTNNDSTVSTNVTREVDLDVSISESTDPVVPGEPGAGNLVYTVTLDQEGPSDATGISVTVNLNMPSGVSIEGTDASTGSLAGNVWSIPALSAGSSATLTVTLTVDSSTALGTDVIDITATVAGANEALIDTGDDTDTEATSVATPALVSATKEVDGTFRPGGEVTYTIVLSNAGPGTQLDNPGDEFVDVLPSSLILDGASASDGTVLANLGTNTVTWNGSIPDDGTVTITIDATIGQVANGAVIENQGTVNYDADGNGTNEASAPTEGDGGGATAFAVNVDLPADIPLLDARGLFALAALLSVVALALLRR